MNTVIVGLGLVISTIALIPNILGFGTVGIAAGSAAAGIQSWIGAVSSGSLFAIVQSLAMKGIFLGSSLVGAAIAGGGVVFEILRNFFY